MNKVVFIREPVSEDVANNMIALTLYLDSLDKKRIYYWLNCPGGDVSTGLSAGGWAGEVVCVLGLGQMGGRGRGCKGSGVDDSSVVPKMTWKLPRRRCE